MSIQAFYTQNAPAAPATAGAAGAKPQSGINTNPTMAFMDLMLANILQKTSTPQTQTQQAPAQDAEVLQSTNPLLDKKPTLDIASLIAANPEVKQQVEELIKPTLDSTGDEISQTLVLNQKAFDEILKPLIDKNLLPQETVQKLEALKTENKNGDIALQDILATLLPQLQDLNAKGQITISNLTPEQVTDIQNKLTTLKSGKDMSEDVTSEAVASILQSLLTQVKITQPAATTQITATTETSAENPSEDLFNALVKMQENGQTPNPSDLNKISVGEKPETTDSAEKPSSFDDLVQDLMGNKGGKEKTPTIVPDTQAKMVKPDAQHVLPNLPSIAGMETSNFFTVPDWSQTMADSLSLGTGAITSASTLANPVTQAQSVTQSVPGTQIVAMTMQKMGMDGQNRSITLQLDPPELGRVEVKMNFDKNKSVKAVLTVEKPETFHMLQRNAHALERAMNDIGLNAEGGMSFELAQDGHNFNQDGGHDGSRHSALRGEGNSDDGDIIQSTMTWQVDNATGHTRYNIWA